MPSPKIETRKAVKIAYIEHLGPYGEIPWAQYVERLYGWAKGQKVMPGFYPMSLYHDDPKKTSPDRCRSEIAITFKGDGKERDGVRIRELPEMTVATISHKGPGVEFEKTYAKLNEWIAEKGYILSGPPIEVYSKKPEVVDGVTIIYAKVMMPVCKK